MKYYATKKDKLLICVKNHNDGQMKPDTKRIYAV